MPFSTNMFLGACVLICLCASSPVFACDKMAVIVYAKTPTFVGAGTNGNMEIKILMRDGASGWLDLDNWWKNDLEAGTKDKFVLDVCPKGTLRGFVLRNTGVSDWRHTEDTSWFPEWIRVQDGNRENNPCVECHLNAWLDEDNYLACGNTEPGYDHWEKNLRDARLVPKPTTAKLAKSKNHQFDDGLAKGCSIRPTKCTSQVNACVLKDEGFFDRDADRYLKKIKRGHCEPDDEDVWGVKG